MKIGVDIGGSHIGIGLVNNGKIVEKKEILIQTINKKEEEKTEKIIKLLEENIGELINKYGECIELIGISVPGIAYGTKSMKLDNLGIKEIDFLGLEKSFKTKVKAINDGNAAALAEKKYGALKNYKDCIFLCLGTGVGGAVFLDNKLLTARNSLGFEIGHMVIEKNGILCNCGKKGCFEKYAAMSALKNKVIKELEKIYNDENILEKKYFSELVKENIDNKNIQKAMDEFTDNLVIGFSNLIDLFLPEAICIGGSFAYFKQWMYESLVDKMEKKKYAFYKSYIPKIEIAEFKNDAGIIGAVLQ